MCLSFFIKAEVGFNGIIKRGKLEIKCFRRLLYFFRSEKIKCFMREKMVLGIDI